MIGYFKKKTFIDKLYWNKFTKPLWRLVPDKLYAKLLYFRKRGVWLDWDNLIGFDQKLVKFKLENRDPMTTLCADKYLVREYVKEKVGEEILIKLLGVYDFVDEIEIESLPEKFVLKANHGSQMNIICKDKKSIDWKTSKKQMKKWLNSNYYWISREWQYKNISPKIICEEFIGNTTGSNIKEFRFFCFDGEPTLIAVNNSELGLNTNVISTRNIYDADFNFLDVTLEYPNNPNEIIEKPKHFEKMKEIAKKLSEGFPQVRVDLYYLEETIYFGELTFCHSGGGQKFYPEEFNTKIGELIKI